MLSAFKHSVAPPSRQPGRRKFHSPQITAAPASQSGDIARIKVRLLSAAAIEVFFFFWQGSRREHGTRSQWGSESDLVKPLNLWKKYLKTDWMIQPTSAASLLKSSSAFGEKPAHLTFCLFCLIICADKRRPARPNEMRWCAGVWGCSLDHSLSKQLPRLLKYVNQLVFADVITCSNPPPLTRTHVPTIQRFIFASINHCSPPKWEPEVPPTPVRSGSGVLKWIKAIKRERIPAPHTAHLLTQHFPGSLSAKVAVFAIYFFFRGRELWGSFILCFGFFFNVLGWKLRRGISFPRSSELL